ncbi:MAG: rhomboid family intramembrane serine protease [Bacteroidota bacterium]|nr:rhomboid family intramembrane serine protease [Bacteroidota bacterium]
MSIEKKRFIHSLVFPFLFVCIIWLVKLAEFVLHINLSFLGIFPLHLKGLSGILFAPLIHGGMEHLMANTVPIFVLGVGLFYFYNKIAYKVFFLIFLLSNIWLWFGGREAYHIGASGIIYGLAFFLFVSGMIRKNGKLMAISLLVVFLYGSLVWGLLPIKPKVSWEGHLYGAISGLVLAIYYREKGPKRKIYSWEFEDEEDDDDEQEDEFNEEKEYDKDTDKKNTEINYFYKNNISNISCDDE